MTTSMDATGTAAGEISAVLARARAGDRAAWDAIVSRHHRSLLGAAVAAGAAPATAADAVQETWLSAYRHLDDLRDGQALGGWLHAILRRELLKDARRRRHEVLCADTATVRRRPDSGDRDVPTPEAALLRTEEHSLVRRAQRRLPARDRALLSLLVADPAPGYVEISRRMRMPVGSIGPTRGRCLRRLRRELELLGVAADPAGCADRPRRAEEVRP